MNEDKDQILGIKSLPVVGVYTDVKIKHSITNYSGILEYLNPDEDTMIISNEHGKRWICLSEVVSFSQKVEDKQETTEA